MEGTDRDLDSPRRPVDWVRAGLREHEASTALKSLGRYEHLEEIGSGATAVVYRATDRSLGRPVALKVLREGVASHESVRQRFLREAQVSAKLSHPNIVTVFEIGEEQGRMFLAMELVEGSTLKRVLEESRLDLPGKVRLLEQVARGVQQAHVHGVVHRDLKPANILVTGAGVPKVVDFGLAHLLESQTQLTQSGAAVGTPMYMAPEQVGGDKKEISARTDVYALGAILYEILTGQPPHTGVTAAEVYGRILRDDPIPPRRMNPRLPEELQTIAWKALEKDPGRRYAGAGAFAEDLRLFLAGEPIEALPVSSATRAWRKAAKHRNVLLPLTGLLVVAAILGAAAVTGAFWKPSKVRELLEKARALEEQGGTEEAWKTYQSILELEPDHTEARSASDRLRAGMDSARAKAAARERDRNEALRIFESSRDAMDQFRLALYDEGTDFEDLRRRASEVSGKMQQAVALAPDLPSGHYLMGRLWEMMGETPQAESCWRKAVELDPRFIPARHALGRLLTFRGFLTALAFFEDPRLRSVEEERLASEALRQFEAAVEEEEAGIENASARIFHLRAKGEMDRAFALAQESLHRYGDIRGSEEIHWLKGILSMGEEQIRALDRALAIRPNYLLALFSRAEVRRLAGDWSAALSDLDRILRIHPKLSEALCYRGNVKLHLGDTAGALADCDEALHLHPDSLAYRTNRGNIREAMGDFDGAIEEHNRVLQRYPDYVMALRNRGAVYYRKRKLDKALADFARAVVLDPENVELRIYCARVRGESGDWKGCIADLDQAVRIDPKCALAWFNRGVARRQAGDPDGAIDDWSRTLELDPRSADAYYYRGDALASRGETEAAERDVRRALELAPSDWVHHATARGLLRRLTD